MSALFLSRIFLLCCFLAAGCVQGQGLSAEAAEWQREYARAARLAGSKKDSALIVTTRLLDRLRTKKALDSPFGLQVQLVHSEALIHNDSNQTSLSLLLELKTKSERQGQWKIFAETCRAIGLIEEYLGDRQASIANLRMAQTTIQKHGLDTIYAPLAVRLASHFRVFNEPDSAVFYAQQAMFYAKKWGQTFEEAEANLILGLISKTQNNRPKAVQYLKAAAYNYRKIEAFSTLAAVHISLSRICLEDNEIAAALAHNDTALTVLNNKNMARYSVRSSSLSSSYQTRGQIYRKMGLLDSAFLYIEKAYAISNNNLQEENKQHLREVDKKYQVAQKNAEIEAQKREINVAAERRNWLWGGILINLLFSGMLLYYYLKLGTANEKNRRQAEVLQNLDVAKSRFFTNISHEFRTPLTVILGMADRLTNNAGVRLSRADTTTSLELIQRNGQNLLWLINQILDLSKLDSGLLRVQWQRSDIMAYLHYLTESFYAVAQEQEVVLAFYPEVPDLEMDYDAEKMQAIVANLLSNALKFTPRGGKIVLRAKSAPHAAGSEMSEYLQLVVQDTGKGISEVELPHIFDRFYQVDDSSTRSGEGTGIGLAYVKELTTLLGGRIAVESTVDKGTTFTLLFPLKGGMEKIVVAAGAPVEIMSGPNPASILQPITSETRNQKRETPGNLPLLLIIEDNADVATYLRSLLQTDYQIEWAPNGQAGIECALELVPDIIISDVMMPEKDGYEVCHTLKNDERTSHIPIILLTAKATQADKLAGLRTGADAYLEKPFHKEELFVRLQKLVELRATLQARYAALPPVASVAIVGPSALSLDGLFLQKLHHAVLEKLDDPELDMAYLCQATHLSHTQVFRKLKALTGENPTQYITRLRLNRALELLQTTSHPVSEVAYLVGFNDPNYFSRAFQKEYGKTPREVRN
jgi:signal transduction histidine kinase/DNA-binding response OmpR family regulator